MGDSFLKKQAFILSGSVIISIFSYIALGIYTRSIGLEGFAIIGIIFSFFELIFKLDLPFFLTLVKYNSKKLKNQKRLFEQMSNTLYNFIVITNFFVFPIALLLAKFLSDRVYKNPVLFMYYVFGLFIFMFNRVNLFFERLIRANGKEKIIQEIKIMAWVVSFLCTLSLLFVFGLGVWAIFIGIFIEDIIIFFLLSYHISKKIIRFRFFFSFPLFLKANKDIIFSNYIANLAYTLSFSGSFFISTFYLNPVSLGLLRVIYTIITKLFNILHLFSFHLITLYSSIFNKNKLQNILKFMQKISFLFFITSAIAMSFILTIGKPVLSWVLPNQSNGIYLVFTIIAIGTILRLPVFPKSYFIFTTHIKIYRKIQVISAIISLAILFPLLHLFGIFGFAMTYFFTCTLFLLFYTYYFEKIIFVSIPMKHLLSLFPIGILVGLILFLYPFWIQIPLNFQIGLFIIINSILIIISIKKVIESLKYFYSLD